MQADYSRAALLKFMDYVVNKGLLNSNTAGARKAACNKILGILDEQEAADLRTLDLDSVMTRFSNLKKNEYAPESLQNYQSRMKIAVSDFVAYTDNPMGFKSNASSATRKLVLRPRPPKAQNEPITESGTHVSHNNISSPQTAVSIMPIQLRADLTVYVQGLPFDLTLAEANKLANVMKALATTD